MDLVLPMYNVHPNFSLKNLGKESSVQDGGIGRNAPLPPTTKPRITTNLKTKTTRTARKSNCMEL